MNRNVLLALVAMMLYVSCSQDGNKMKDMKKTKRGFAYELLETNNGKAAVVGDEVYFHVKAIAGDSVLFDSRSRIMPQQFTVMPEEKIEPGSNPLLDLFGLMATGDVARLYYPMDSLKTPPPGFEDEKYLEYELSMEYISRKETHSGKEREEEIANLIQGIHADYKKGKLELKETETGLKMLILEEGDGKEVRPNDFVGIHYYGVLAKDGKMFDNSFARSKPFVTQIGVGSVIRGWDEGIAGLKQGTKAVLFIPSDMAYGDRDNGTIPANSELIFYVELLD